MLDLLRLILAYNILYAWLVLPRAIRDGRRSSLRYEASPAIDWSYLFPSVGAVSTPQRRLCSPLPPNSPTSKVDTLGKCSVCAKLDYLQKTK